MYLYISFQLFLEALLICHLKIFNFHFGIYRYIITQVHFHFSLFLAYAITFIIKHLEVPSISSVSY